VTVGATPNIDWLPKPNGADRAIPREISKPRPLDEAAFYGVAGEFVRIIEPHTEADPAALLVQFLSAPGVWIGRTGYYLAEADRHNSNLYVAIVGRTAKGRKGTSWGHVRRFLELAEPNFQPAGGLSTGDGLIHHVRDERYEQKLVKDHGRIPNCEPVLVDAGITDKRLLVVEPELSRVLRASQRDGSTLSAVMRQAWDTGDLRSMTKTSDEVATGAHIGIIGHITQQELTQMLASIDVANGFANRFLWVWAQRSKELPFGGSLNPDALDEVRAHLQRARAFTQNVRQIKFEDEAAILWERCYAPLSAERLGRCGAILARGSTGSSYCCGVCTARRCNRHSG